MEDHSPPGHLSEKSKALWKEIVPRRAKSPERLALLEEALNILDRLAAIREQIKDDELIAKGEKMEHLHPLLKAEKDWSVAFVKTWKTLGLAHDQRDFFDLE